MRDDTLRQFLSLLLVMVLLSPMPTAAQVNTHAQAVSSPGVTTI